MRSDGFDGLAKLQKFIRDMKATERHDALVTPPVIETPEKYFTLMRSFDGVTKPTAFHVTEIDAAGLIAHAKRQLERVASIPGNTTDLFELPTFRLEAEV